MPRDHHSWSPSMKYQLIVAVFIILPSLVFAGELERGQEALKDMQYDQAIACFTAYIHDNPKDAAAFYQRGIAYTQKQELDTAISDYTAAIQLDPAFDKAFHNRGD